MANQSKSQVQVSINAKMENGFTAAFSNADKRMQALSKTASDLSSKVGNVQAYRKQQNALKESAAAFNNARSKVAALKAEIAASEKPTRRQAAALDAAERAAKRAGAAYTEARTKAADMARELQRAGVNVGNLSKEYRRLQAEVGKANAKQIETERSLARQQKLVQNIGRVLSASAKAWHATGAAVTGTIAAGAVLAQPTKKAINYDESLARLSDTAVAGGGDYKASKAALSGAVQAALAATKGGTRESAISGLSSLISGGGMGVQEAGAALPSIMKTAFASDTPAEQIANLALKMKAFGVSDTGAGLDVLYRSGQVGGVELKNMAQSLPEQLAAGRSAGYSGNRGLAEIGAMNQIALGTAGDATTAANNVTNLLNKLASPELAKNIKKVTGVDFDKVALENQSKGIYKAETFAMLADKQMMKDKSYAALKKQSESAKTPEERAVKIKEMAAMMEGSQMGQFIQDRQALAAALAMVDARKRKDERDPSKTIAQAQVDYALNGKGGVNSSLVNLQGETFAKTQMLSNNIDKANEDTFNKINGPLSSVIDKLNEAAVAYPNLTTAAYSAATALGALAAAGLGVGGYKLLTSGATAATAGAGTGAAATAAGAAKGAGFLGIAGKLAGPLMAATSIANFTSKEEDAIIEKSINAEKAHFARLKKQYGMDTLNQAYQTQSPFYQFGGVENAKPANVENWVKKYLDNKAATDAAAKSAGDAAKAAQSRPNMTITNSYSVQVTAPPSDDPLKMKSAVEFAVREAAKKAERDQRSLMFDKPGY